MPASPQLVSVLYALGAFLTWGISDFVGGYTARRFNSFYLAAIGHFSGTVLMVTLALANHESIPSLAHLRWAFAAGVCGGGALALFYRALLVATGLITLVGRKFTPAYPAGFGLGLLAGCIDVTGTFLFVRASQTGRLDTAVVLSSLYPALTVLLARFFLGEHFTRWKTVGMVATLVAVPMIAAG